MTAVLDRAPALGPDQWWLTAGVLFQAVWNALTGRSPGAVDRDGRTTVHAPHGVLPWESRGAAAR